MEASSLGSMAIFPSWVDGRRDASGWVVRAMWTQGRRYHHRSGDCVGVVEPGPE